MVTLGKTAAVHVLRDLLLGRFFYSATFALSYFYPLDTAALAS
jgi:hypothetical protein